ncbi:hypothetical protein FOL47_005011 [Perkinsus chesapeaki]|uniref:ribonuclease P n=1 Tax=Perkinsus chesapeaki TaxID=330153 RepID=A0A7J6LZP7_PERCH|nr:hypothetical protein FOL47_005011 [Perkinsus chesapeaki]
MVHQKNSKEVALKRQLKAFQTKMYTSAREHDILGAFKTYEEIIENDEFVKAGLTKGMHGRILTVAASDVNLEAGCPSKDIATAKEILRLSQEVLAKCSERQENILTSMVKLAVAAGEIDLALEYHKECLTNFQPRLRSYVPLLQLYSSPQYQDFDAVMNLVADLEGRGFTLGDAELSYILRCCPAGKGFDFLANKVANTIDVVTDSRLTDSIQTMGDRDSNIEVQSTEIAPDGTCTKTGIKLQSIDITDDELHELSELTERLATQNLSEEQQEKFRDLQRYLDDQSRPATIIVDAANIGHMNQNYADGFFQHSQIDDVAEHFIKEGKKVLVILHSKWLEPGLDLTVGTGPLAKKRRKIASKHKQKLARLDGTFAPELDPELTSSSAPASASNPESPDEAGSSKPQSSHESEEDDIEELSEEKRNKYNELIKKYNEKWAKQSDDKGSLFELYRVPPRANDDWFWMYAAIRCEEQARELAKKEGKEPERVFVISNDLMRDHFWRMMVPQSFLRWRERHVCRVKITFPEEDVDKKEYTFEMPSDYSTRVQHQGPYCHVPITRPIDDQQPETETKWLVVIDKSKD